MREFFEKAFLGDSDAQGEIVRVIRQLSRAVCSGGGPDGSAVDWEDIAQDASERFFSVGIRQFHKVGSERSFLYSIIRSTILQRVRSETRRRARERASTELHVVAHNTGDAFDVRKILVQLTEDCRDLLTRVFLQDEPYSTLAGDLGVLESSVRVKVSRCLQKARELVEESGKP
jgi:RNA polymerase sigma factor (sigma-70 family)